MPGILYQYLAGDHDRLDGLLQRAVAKPGARVTLLVPPPAPSIVLTIHSIVEVHNALEEQEGGLYQRFEQFTGPHTGRLPGQLNATPDMPVLRHNERPGILVATHRALARAGHEFKSVPQ